MRKIAVVLGFILVAVSAPVLAAEGDMKLRFGAAHIGPTGDQTIVWYDEPPEYEESRIEPEGGLSGFVGFEFMVSNVVGLDTTVLGTNINVEEDYLWVIDDVVQSSWRDEVADIFMTSFIFSANIHVVNNDQMDLYLGPSVAYIWYGDWDWDDDDWDLDLKVDDEFTLGGVIGIDLPLGSGKWMFSSAVRYLNAEAELDDVFFAYPVRDFTLEIDPWIVQVGVGVKF
jgi:outer membrane protein W